jgi:ABC-type polysaccharide/polyol phosphate transport system ATPase subunit
MAAAIEIRGISKHFRLYHEHYSSLKERMIHFGRIPFEEFWALTDIEFDVEEGTTVGLLGHNGSGKSTLLKCVAGILQPTQGEIVTRGRLAALLELGAGFHPELTGRENIYLNGSLLGLAKKDIDKIFDEIVAFAELEQFIDLPVRTYSTGMQLRLAFSAATAVRPDVLVVDEALAVGDAYFQHKSFDRIRNFRKAGTTLLIVSHDRSAIQSICDTAILLEGDLTPPRTGRGPGQRYALGPPPSARPPPRAPNSRGRICPRCGSTAPTRRRRGSPAFRWDALRNRHPARALCARSGGNIAHPCPEP